MNGSRRKLTSAGIETVVSTGDLDSGLTAVNDPVLCAGAVAVVAEDSKSNSQSRSLVDVNVHLNGSAVGHDTALDIETLAGVTVGVNLVRAGGGRGVRAGLSSGAEESLLDALVEAAVRWTGMSARFGGTSGAAELP